jgi:hypothetical protein
MKALLFVSLVVFAVTSGSAPAAELEKFGVAIEPLDRTSITVSEFMSFEKEFEDYADQKGLGLRYTPFPLVIRLFEGPGPTFAYDKDVLWVTPTGAKLVVDYLVKTFPLADSEKARQRQEEDAENRDSIDRGLAELTGWDIDLYVLPPWSMWADVRPIRNSTDIPSLHLAKFRKYLTKVNEGIADLTIPRGMILMGDDEVSLMGFAGLYLPEAYILPQPAEAEKQ